MLIRHIHTLYRDTIYRYSETQLVQYLVVPRYACVACMQVTQHVALLSKWVAADLYAKELDLLQFELSMSRGNVDLWAAVEAVEAEHAAVAGALHLISRAAFVGVTDPLSPKTYT